MLKQASSHKNKLSVKSTSTEHKKTGEGTAGMGIVQSGLKYSLRFEDNFLANSDQHLKCACEKFRERSNSTSF